MALRLEGIGVRGMEEIQAELATKAEKLEFTQYAIRYTKPDGPAGIAYLHGSRPGFMDSVVLWASKPDAHMAAMTLKKRHGYSCIVVPVACSVSIHNPK